MLKELKPTESSIVSNFNKSAGVYDHYSSLQREVAETLCNTPNQFHPTKVLDIGCGTGHATSVLARKWPKAQITALDAAPEMLEIMRKKAPNARVLHCDATQIPSFEKFDLIVSSMMLHWLPDPLKAVNSWRKLLSADGNLWIATPVSGSLMEWRDLCYSHQLPDRTWEFPPEKLLVAVAVNQFVREHVVEFDGLNSFLSWLKSTGANTPNRRSSRISTNALRRLVLGGDKGFICTFRILYAHIQK